MTRFVVDSSAWIEYFDGSEKGARIRKYIESPGNELFVTGIIAAEVSVKYLKAGLQPDEMIVAMKALSRVCDVDIDAGLNAARVFVERRKTREKFGLIDAHVVSLSEMGGASILTCDTDFKGLGNALVF